MSSHNETSSLTEKIISKIQRKFQIDLQQDDKKGHLRKIMGLKLKKDSLNYEQRIIQQDNDDTHKKLNSSTLCIKAQLVTILRTLQSNFKRIIPFQKTIDESKKSDEVSEIDSSNQSMSAKTLLNRFGSKMSTLEKNELETLKESKIYYMGRPFGPNSLKGHATTPVDGNEIPFDDELGDYRIIKNDHIAYRYQIMDILGKGTFGQVVRVIDHKEPERPIAIKLLRNRKRFIDQGYTEISILNSLKPYSYSQYPIVQMEKYCMFRGHLCIVFELLGSNLYELMKQQQFRGFNLDLIRHFATQLLQALSVLEDHRIIHCDLKPENILLKEERLSDIKLIDFGSSCFQHKRIHTYIQSRFYRAPEIILGINYTNSIDMWSFGCILAEFYTGAPLFAGSSESDQLLAIMEILGHVPQYLLDLCSKKSVLFDCNGVPIWSSTSAESKEEHQSRKPASKRLDQVIQCNDQAFLDIIYRSVMYDANERLTPKQALEHQWIKNDS